MHPKVGGLDHGGGGGARRVAERPEAVMEEKLVASPAVCWCPFSVREG